MVPPFESNPLENEGWPCFSPHGKVSLLFVFLEKILTDLIDEEEEIVELLSTSTRHFNCSRLLYEPIRCCRTTDIVACPRYSPGLPSCPAFVAFFCLRPSTSGFGRLLDESD